MERWATFDCYETLVDWRSGIRSGIEALLGTEDAEGRLERYYDIEREIQAASPGVSYREVLTLGLERLAAEEGASLPEGEASLLARSLPDWPVFPDVRPALEGARERGWRLAILSNTDRDLIEASLRAIGVPFELAIVAGEIGSYKPGRRHWDVFRETTGVAAAGHVHVAQSLFHDIAASAELGIPSVWINREGQPADPRPAVTLPDLTGLADVLDRLAPST